MASSHTELFVTPEDKVVLSDLLFFLTNRLNTHPSETVRNICDTFYDEKIVMEEKSLIFQIFVKNSAKDYKGCG